LGHDHLQDHGGFEAYAALKARFIQQVMDDGGLVVVNAQQVDVLHHVQRKPWKGYMRRGVDLNMAFAGRLRQADMMHWDVQKVGQVILQHQGKRVLVHDVPVGQFHAENLAAVAQVLRYCFAMDLPTIASCLQAMPAPPGRMQAVKNAQHLQVYIDYAHTPEGLQACLQSVRTMMEQKQGKVDAKQGALMLVFGCGGNRDVRKRAEMGEVAAKHADNIWITSDNPRDEDPERIMDDVLKGMPTSNAVHRCVRRADAIAQALQAMGEHDVLIVAGKGHEECMEINGEKIPWHDETWVRRCLESMAEASACS